MYEGFGPISANPMRFIGRLSGKKVPAEYDPEKYRAPIGEPILVDIAVLLIISFLFILM